MRPGWASTEVDPTRRDEMLRLCQRLDEDRTFRILGGLTGILLAVVFLPFIVIVIAATVFLSAEGAQPILHARFRHRPTHRAYIALLANALLGTSGFTLVPFINFIAMPAAVAGATAFYLDTFSKNKEISRL